MKTFEAEVVAVLAARDKHSFVTSREERVVLDLAGIPGDRHYGLLRPADSRQKFYPRGTLIANRRQISIVSLEECARIAGSLGIERIEPEWLGANLLLSGYEPLTLLHQGARLLFPGGAGLICEGENEPCRGPGKVIGAAVGNDALANVFVKAAKHLRGIVCSVEKEGSIITGERVRIITME